MDIKSIAAKRAASMFGIDPDASLPELIEAVNDSFDLGLNVSTPDTLDAVKAALYDVAATSDNCARTGGRIFVITARPEGKPPVKAFIVVG